MLKKGFYRVPGRLYSSKAQTVPRLTQHFIDGEFVDSISGMTFLTENPANEQIITEIQCAEEQDVDRAVEAARRAFDHGPWRKFSGTERGNCLLRLTELIEKNAEELSVLETLDSGIPYVLVKGVEIHHACDVMRYYAGWADKIHGDTIPMEGDYFAYTRKEPVGVAAQFIPWNLPFKVLCANLSPALAAGCTVVIKPAEQTPLSSLKIAELVKEAGIPDGVVNILNGYGKNTGAYLSTHPDVDKIAFTGSCQIGMEIMKNSAANNKLKRVQLELGGKSPNIILDDVDVDKAVAQANFASFLLEGQTCLSGSRTFVHEKIYDEFVEKSTNLVKEVKFGDSFDEATTHGPLISKLHRERVMKYIKIGQKEGATLTTGGTIPDRKGYYLQPAVFADVTDNMTIAREEIFGPVMSILKFSDIDEVIHMANDTEFGLASGVMTNDISKAMHLANGIRAGTVYINCYNVLIHTTPFGGFKNSGIGRDYGQPGVESYYENKTVVIARPSESLP